MIVILYIICFILGFEFLNLNTDFGHTQLFSVIWKRHLLMKKKKTPLQCIREKTAGLPQVITGKLSHREVHLGDNGSDNHNYD